MPDDNDYIHPTAVSELDIEARLGEGRKQLATFCRTHAIRQLDVFGSIVRADFGAGSDIDLLVTFRPGQTPSLFEHMKLERALSELLRRRIDLISLGAVIQSENELLRDEIFSTRRTVFREQL